MLLLVLRSGLAGEKNSLTDAISAARHDVQVAPQECTACAGYTQL
jgi:hypothetical protein